MLVVVYICLVAGPLFLGSSVITNIEPPDVANRAKHFVQMFSDKGINICFDIFVDVATIDGTFNQSSCFSTIAREERRVLFDLLFGEVGYGSLERCFRVLRNMSR